MITLLPLPHERASTAGRELSKLAADARGKSRRPYVSAHCAKLLADVARQKGTKNVD